MYFTCIFDAFCTCATSHFAIFDPLFSTEIPLCLLCTLRALFQINGKNAHVQFLTRNFFLGNFKNPKAMYFTCNCFSTLDISRKIDFFDLPLFPIFSANVFAHVQFLSQKELLNLSFEKRSQQLRSLFDFTFSYLSGLSHFFSFFFAHVQLFFGRKFFNHGTPRYAITKKNSLLGI